MLNKIYFLISFFCTVFFLHGDLSAHDAAQKVSENSNETMALVYVEDVDDSSVCQTEKECIEKRMDAIDRIPNVDMSDFDTDENAIILHIVDKRLTDAAVIKSVLNSSKIFKVKKIMIPAPKMNPKPRKNPYEGMSKADIKRSYDAYYREHPKLTPKNWKFSE